jgi:hypothetical protein
VASTGRSSAIQCHRCQGLGHVARECPSKRAYIVTEDGGYVSASDIEDDAKEEEASNEDQHGLSFDSDGVGNQKICIVQRVLSRQMEEAEKQQRHNLFQILFVIKDRCARVIIDEVLIWSKILG